jgi:hypothetical protein
MVVSKCGFSPTAQQRAQMGFRSEALRRAAIVILQHAAESLAADNFAFSLTNVVGRREETNTPEIACPTSTPIPVNHYGGDAGLLRLRVGRCLQVLRALGHPYYGELYLRSDSNCFRT